MKFEIKMRTSNIKRPTLNVEWRILSFLKSFFSIKACLKTDEALVLS